MFCKYPFCSCSHQNMSLLEWEQTNDFINISYQIQMNAFGKGQVVFETAAFTVFSIVVENGSSKPICAWIEISPNGNTYKQDSEKVQVSQREGIEIFVTSLFLKYTRLKIEGESGLCVKVYLQGKY